MDDDNPGRDQSVDLMPLKREVDALQVAIHEQRTPWYKNIPIIISIIALLFSFGTTYVSYKRTQSQDIQDARVELRGLLQRLASLPRENVEFTKKYESIDPGALALISGSINQENTLLARQAAEIAMKLPSNAVSATEYYSVGVALQNAYNVEDAMMFYSRAVDVSTNINDRVAALRSRAYLLFLTGQAEAGRVDYQRALNIFSDFKDTSYNDYTKRSIHIWTELGWANSEANIGSMDVALQHVENAQRYLSGLIVSPGADQLRNQINQARNLMSGAEVISIPLSESPLSAQTPLGGIR